MVYRCAVDIGATRTMLALVHASQAEVLAHERPNSDILFTGLRLPGIALADAVLRFLQQHDVRPSEVLGVGVGIPGNIDRETGKVLSCPNLPVLDGADMAHDASAELGIPVYMANNTNLIALGEHSAGIGRGVQDMAVVFVGSGLGCGLILNDQLYEGADGVASEFGHTIIVPNGLLCSCGSHGCLEMYCSGKALARRAESTFGPRELYALNTRFAGSQLLIEQSLAGHSRATEVLTEAFTFLGLGLSNLANMLNPRLLVLGGGVVFYWPQGLEVARQVIMREALPAVRRNLRIEMSSLRNFAGVLGGAALVSRMCGMVTE